jgi:hypothetical protein
MKISPADRLLIIADNIAKHGKFMPENYAMRKLLAACAAAALRPYAVTNNLQSHERLRPAMWRRLGEFNFLNNGLSFVDLPPRPECGSTAENIASGV